MLHSLKFGTGTSTRKKVEKLKYFDFTEDGDSKNFLGVNVERTDSGFHMPHPHLISRILDTAGLTGEDPSGRSTRGTPDPLPIKDTNGEPI